MATELVLREGCLNDDTLSISEPGCHFINGHATGKFMVTYWTFANEWCNHPHYFIAKTLENALKRYQKICGKLEEDVLESICTSVELS